jgi:calcium-dependent protein kinase
MEESKKEADPDFKTIEETYSTTDIRTVYKFEKLIGGGHFGTVRIAHPISDPEKSYAVKSLLRESIRKEVKLLESELQILKTLDHPNIIKFYETYVDYRYVHIVMELCTGGELFDRIVEAQKFSEAKAAKLMQKILSAVKHLHEHGIAHRDLKPENFLFLDKSDDAEIKIIDFGLSKKFDHAEMMGEMKTIVGTPFYVAPEVLQGQYDKQCDVWSIGVILYILLCGYPPFDGDNNKEIFRAIMKNDLEFDPEDWSQISAEGIDLIKKMLDKDLSRRITLEEASKHPWLTMWDEDDSAAIKDLNDAYLARLANYRAPHRL